MLRSVTENDFNYIFELYMHPAINSFLMYEEMDASAFRTIFDQLLQQEVLWIMEVDNKQVGMIKLAPMQYRCSHIVYIGGVAIHPDHKGQGWGLQMMQEAITLILAKGYLRAELSVAVENEKAIRIYEKVGFKKVGVLKNFGYLQSKNRFVDEWLMEYLPST